ncbi:MAG: hypothetical protein E3J21_17930 [Anaerolineales bacterium]|nr:MAG: hypothetical protein E3J21_17930 [Anaerolineales bacterium]
MALTSAEEPRFEEASPRSPGLGWRIGIIALGLILAGVACGLIVVALGQSTWAISNMADPGLNPEARSRLEALRDKVDADGTAPEAVGWMNDALDPNADGTSVLAYLRAAQKALEAADDPKLAEAVKELKAIFQIMRPTPIRKTTTPRPMITLEWPSPPPAPTLEWP